MTEKVGGMERENKRGRVEWGSLKLSRCPAVWLLYNIRATSTKRSAIPGICVSIHKTTESPVEEASVTVWFNRPSLEFQLKKRLSSLSFIMWRVLMALLCTTLVHSHGLLLLKIVLSIMLYSYGVHLYKYKSFYTNCLNVLNNVSHGTLETSDYFNIFISTEHWV